MNISPNDLRSIIDYDPSTGILTWKARSEKFFGGGRPTIGAAATRWNNRYAGTRVLGLDRKGYVRFSLLGRMVRAHRVIWAIMTGYWPDVEVDHRDGDRANNKWENLRLAPGALNAANRGASRGSTSPHVGVSWSKAHGKWRAQIQHGNENRHIGYFASEADAASAYSEAAKFLRGDWARAAE